MLALYFFSYPLSQVTMITGLIIVGLIIDLGGAPNHHRLGFQVSIKANWKSFIDLTMRVVLEKPRCPRRCSTGTNACWPGSLPRHFECSRSSIILIPGHGTCRNVSNTPFAKGRSSFSKSIFSAASETENPRRNIAKAVRRVFFRILVFYVSLCCFCWDDAGPDGGCA